LLKVKEIATKKFEKVVTAKIISDENKDSENIKKDPLYDTVTIEDYSEDEFIKYLNKYYN